MSEAAWTRGEFIERLRAEDIPAAARREAENTVIDTVGLTIAALEAFATGLSDSDAPFSAATLRRPGA